MEWLNLILTLVFGYISTREEIEKFLRKRKLGKLEKSKSFYERLQASTAERTNYLAHSILVNCVIAGVTLLLREIQVDNPHYYGLINLFAGASIYIFSINRLARYRRATTTFERTIKPINEEIERLKGVPS